MVFDINRFTRSSVAFNAGRITTSFAPSSTPAFSNGPDVWTYASSTDSIATISADNYFASQVDSICVDDLIFAVGSDANLGLKVVTVDKDAGTITRSEERR